jgi:hypothetical protein
MKQDQKSLNGQNPSLLKLTFQISEDEKAVFHCSHYQIVRKVLNQPLFNNRGLLEDEVPLCDSKWAYFLKFRYVGSAGSELVSLSPASRFRVFLGHDLFHVQMRRAACIIPDSKTPIKINEPGT